VKIAIDGTKSRAHNSKKANFNQKKIDRHLVYIEERTQEYLAELAKNDLQDNSITITKIAEKIERLKRIKYATNLEEKLKQSGQPQISTTDQDARAL
jgi:putative ribosome biogenesis GTPase RsgA